MTYKSTMYACEFGIISQAIVNNLTPILFVIFKDNFGISENKEAAHCIRSGRMSQSGYSRD